MTAYFDDAIRRSVTATTLSPDTTVTDADIVKAYRYAGACAEALAKYDRKREK